MGVLKNPAFFIDAEIKLQMVDLFNQGAQTKKGQKPDVHVRKFQESEVLAEIQRMQNEIDQVERVGPVDLRLDYPDNNGKTRLMEFAARGKVHMVRFFLENRARVDIKDKRGKRAMDYICTEVEDPVEKMKKSEEIRKLLQQTDVRHRLIGGTPKPRVTRFASDTNGLWISKRSLLDKLSPIKQQQELTNILDEVDISLRELNSQLSNTNLPVWTWSNKSFTTITNETSEKIFHFVYYGQNREVQQADIRNSKTYKPLQMFTFYPDHTLKSYTNQKEERGIHVNTEGRLVLFYFKRRDGKEYSVDWDSSGKVEREMMRGQR